MIASARLAEFVEAGDSGQIELPGETLKATITLSKHGSIQFQSRAYDESVDGLSWTFDGLAVEPDSPHRQHLHTCEPGEDARSCGQAHSELRSLLRLTPVTASSDEMPSSAAASHRAQ